MALTYAVWDRDCYATAPAMARLVNDLEMPNDRAMHCGLGNSFKAIAVRKTSLTPMTTRRW